MKEKTKMQEELMLLWVEKRKKMKRLAAAGAVG
jgi:hypothetical protein